jgi:hypothetical protein
MQVTPYFRNVATARVPRKYFSFELQNERVATLLPQLRERRNGVESVIFSCLLGASWCSGLSPLRGGNLVHVTIFFLRDQMRHSPTFCFRQSAPENQLVLTFEEVSSSALLFSAE